MEALEEGDTRIPDNECNDGDESKDRVWYGEAGFSNWVTDIAHCFGLEQIKPAASCKAYSTYSTQWGVSKPMVVARLSNGRNSNACWLDCGGAEPSRRDRNERI